MAKNKRKPAASAMILFMAALMVAACSEKDANHVAGVNNVYVSVTGTESSAAKVSVLETQNIKALTLVFFDAQNNKVFDSTQLKSNFMGVDLANFGRFSCLLPSGTYSMAVFGYDNTSPMTVYGSQAVSFSEPAKMVYYGKQDVQVASSGTKEVSVSLNRITTQFRIKAKERSIPVGVKHLRYTFSKSGPEMNPMTGLSTADNGFTVLSQDYQHLWGDTTITLVFSRDLLLYADEETMDILVEALDAEDNVIISHTFVDVPLKRNRRTSVTGAIFNAEINTAFTVNTDWIDEYDLGSF